MLAYDLFSLIHFCIGVIGMQYYTQFFKFLALFELH